MVSEPIVAGLMPETAEEPDRARLEPDGEKAALLAWLEAQRSHALDILDGLDEAALRRQVLPSGWSCLGMIQHLTGMECFWYRAVVSGERAVIDGIADEPNEWQVSPDVTAASVFAAYRRESERTNAIIAATPLDAPPAWWPDFFGDWRLYTLRDVVLHTLTETACHAGHLDAARELIDGRLWLVLNE